jgi:hypothetical protein
MFALLKLSDIAKYLIARHFLARERWVKNLTVLLCLDGRSEGASP